MKKDIGHFSVKISNFMYWTTTCEGDLEQTYGCTQCDFLA